MYYLQKNIDAGKAVGDRSLNVSYYKSALERMI